MPRSGNSTGNSSTPEQEYHWTSSIASRNKRQKSLSCALYRVCCYFLSPYLTTSIMWACYAAKCGHVQTSDCSCSWGTSHTYYNCCQCGAAMTDTE
ncbi:hypothetical protein BDV32DRAFT_121056 [Aspergillus pseudonomiae]|nr:hypothetical protein BDV32DRAFT_121056 [Aspergillus pseudonomiae]